MPLSRGAAKRANSNGWDLRIRMQYVGWKDLRSAMRGSGCHCTAL